MTERALVVDPRHHTAALVGRAGFDTVGVPDGETALYEYGQRWYDAVFVALALPGLRGSDVCRELRRRSLTPIVATSTDEDTAWLMALDAGADDHVRLPADPAELRARVHAIARRRRGGLATPHVVHLGAVEVRVTGDTVSVGSRLVSGPPATILAALCERPGVVTTATALADSVAARHGTTAAVAVAEHVTSLDALLRTAGAPAVERLSSAFRLAT